MKPTHLIYSLCWLVILPGLFACGGHESTRPGNSVESIASSAASIVPTYEYKGSIEPVKSITSNFTGITYPYHIYLPENYATSAKNYSVIYGTDGQWNFNFFSQTIDKLGKAFIYVGIEQGLLNSDQRAIDYTNTGADRYIQFLKNELIPLIETNYRVNTNRIYVGTSYGGLLGSIMLGRENMGEPYFKTYLLFDGSFWAQNASNLSDEENRFLASKKLPVHLILTSANRPGNESSVNQFESRYKARAYEGMTIDRTAFSIAHNDVADPSFLWAIDLIQ